MAKRKFEEIQLDKGYKARVDAECYAEIMSMGSWYAGRDAGTKRRLATLSVKMDGRKTTIALHRFISRAPKGTVVFFLDGDSMNCTRENLLICTPIQLKILKKLLPPQNKRLKSVA